MVFEGIVISKLPYKERDLIVKILLRNGLMASFYVYGGQGGGKHHKPSAFDVGSMKKVQIKERRSLRHDVSELMVVAEHSPIWEPQSIRHDIRAFYLTCLYFEIVQKFGISFHLEETGQSNDQEGVFTVLSNAIFYLDEAVSKKHFVPEQHLYLFMVKLLFHIGIIPDTESCGYCGTDLLFASGSSFLIAQGQFACLQCVVADNEHELLLGIRKASQTRYQDYQTLLELNFKEADKLIQFFCHHFHLRPVELRSYSLLFK